MKASLILTTATRLQDAIKNNYNGNALELIAGIIDEARAEIAAQTARATGKKAIQAAALRILKSAGAERPNLTKAHATADGVEVSDGFRLIKFNTNDAPPLPTWRWS